MKHFAYLAAALCAASLAGCAGGPAASKADAPAASGAKSVEARAQQRWDLLVAGKAAQAYDFFSPGYRQVKDREDASHDHGKHIGQDHEHIYDYDSNEQNQECNERRAPLRRHASRWMVHDAPPLFPCDTQSGARRRD